VPLSRILLPIVFLVIPLAAIGSRLYAFRRDRRIRRRGRRGEVEIVSRDAVVEELYGQEYLATSKTRRVTTLKLAAEDGRTWLFEEDLGPAGERFELGARAPIWYDPEDPARHVVGLGVSLGRVLSTALLSLPFLLIGLWILLG
jgi:hypothetical protein